MPQGQLANCNWVYVLPGMSASDPTLCALRECRNKPMPAQLPGLELACGDTGEVAQQFVMPVDRTPPRIPPPPRQTPPAPPPPIQCPPDTVRDGNRCTTACPPGTLWDGAKCNKIIYSV